MPGARGYFLACPRKHPKRRTPRRPGPAGLRARTMSGLESSRPAAGFGAGSTRLPVTASLGATSLSLRPRATHQPRDRTQGGLAPNHPATYNSFSRQQERWEVAFQTQSKGRVPLCLASLARGCRVWPAGTPARGSPRQDVASNRPVRNRSVARLIVADTIRGDQARRAKAPGCLLFVGFLGQARKSTRTPGMAANREPRHTRCVRNPLLRLAVGRITHAANTPSPHPDRDKAAEHPSRTAPRRQPIDPRSTPGTPSPPAGVSSSAA